VPTRFGLGFALPPMLSPECPDACFGHPGAGGSLAFADPEARLGFGYAMNQMQLGLTGDARAASLVRATYAALTRPR
jgi:CubicO group peptidase (beta-lactamase class C family)